MALKNNKSLLYERNQTTEFQVLFRPDHTL